jgi:hypothetical protein
MLSFWLSVPQVADVEGVEPHLLKVTWEKNHHTATLKADLKGMSFTVESTSSSDQQHIKTIKYQLGNDICFRVRAMGNLKAFSGHSRKCSTLLSVRFRIYQMKLLQQHTLVLNIIAEIARRIIHWDLINGPGCLAVSPACVMTLYIAKCSKLLEDILAVMLLRFW